VGGRQLRPVLPVRREQQVHRARGAVEVILDQPDYRQPPVWFGVGGHQLGRV
jgi:hypothetical protein